MIDSIVKGFAQKAPVALMFRGLFARVFRPERLDEIFDQHRIWQNNSELLFSSLCDIVHPVVIGAKPSVHASFIDREEELGVSKQAMYEKLAGVEVSVCDAFLEITTAELQSIIESAGATKENVIKGYHTFVIDGKRLDATDHRLHAARSTNSAPLPGALIAVLDTRLELFTKVRCSKYCYANERKLAESMLDELEKGALYLADRNFCDGFLIARFMAAETYFIVRHHGRSPKWRKVSGEPRHKVGVGSGGQGVYEQPIEVYLPAEERWVRVRRITVKLKTATRDGDTELHVLSNLPAKVSGVTIGEGYRSRWTIETSLGRVAMSLNAEINTLAYPGAALFCFMHGLLAFNLISTLKRLISIYHRNKQLPELSDYYLALEIAESKLALEICFTASTWEEIREKSIASFLTWFKTVAGRAKYKKYRKHPRGLKRPQAKRKSGWRKKHFSTQRALEGT